MITFSFSCFEPCVSLSISFSSAEMIFLSSFNLLTSSLLGSDALLKESSCFFRSSHWDFRLSICTETKKAFSSHGARQALKEIKNSHRKELQITSIKHECQTSFLHLANSISPRERAFSEAW